MSNVWLSNIFLNQAQLTRIISLQVQMTLVNIFYLGAVKMATFCRFIFYVEM